MNVVGKFGSLVYSVATPFHPFGGAIDIIVVKQQDGSFRTTPWYVRFGKFQGVLKGTEKIVRIEVNGVESNFHMYLDNSGEAYFIREVVLGKDGEANEGLIDIDSLEDTREENSVDYNNNDDNRETDVNLYRHESSVSNTMELYVQDEQSSHDGSVALSEYGSSHCESLESLEHFLESEDSEVVLVSVDGHILKAPISHSDSSENVELHTPQFHIVPGEGTEASWATGYLSDVDSSTPKVGSGNACEMNNGNEIPVEVCEEDGEHVGFQNRELSASIKCEDTFQSCLELSELPMKVGNGSSLEIHGGTENPLENSPQSHVTTNGTEDKGVGESRNTGGLSSSISCLSRESSLDVPADVESIEEKILDTDHKSSEKGAGSSPGTQIIFPGEDMKSGSAMRVEISLCRALLHAGMGLSAAAEVFNAHHISEEEFKLSFASLVKNENLVVRFRGRYLPWDKAVPIVLGLAAYGLEIPLDLKDAIPVEEAPKFREEDAGPTTTPSRRWSLWPTFRRVKAIEDTSSNLSSEEVFVDFDSPSENQSVGPTPLSPHKQVLRTNIPTTEQIESLNLREGQNVVTFIFSTRVLGVQKVEAHIYLWKWNARIVISDVDGTITKSDVLGQFMPLVGRDWTQSGVARLFCAIKENGYQLLFLSARAIVQAYLTRSYLVNLKQDGKALPTGPVVISPDGLFPSLYREVIRRAPHEFKIACLEDIRALFPSDYNPFYAGFGNRDTDELSYRKIGIPKGKIFIINPKGEVAISHRTGVRSYTSLHTLVNDMFPPTSMVEQEDYNSWNYWRVPFTDIEIL